MKARKKKEEKTEMKTEEFIYNTFKLFKFCSNDFILFILYQHSEVVKKGWRGGCTTELYYNTLTKTKQRKLIL